MLQLPKAIFREFSLLLSPPQISGEVIAGSQRHYCEMDEIGIDSILGHLRNYPHNRPVSSTNDCNNWLVPLSQLLEMLETLFPIFAHVVKENSEVTP